MKDLSQSLNALFDAERTLRAAETALLQNEPKALSELLEKAVKEAKGIDDTDERRLRLERLADLCAQVAGPAMTDALIAILDEPSQAVRVQAGDVLEHLHRADAAPGAAALEHHADAGEQRAAVAHRVQAEHPDRALLGPAVALAGLQRGGLAGAVGTEHRRDRRPLDREGESVDGDLVAVPHHQAVDGDGRGGSGHGRQSRDGSGVARLTVPSR